MGVLFLHCMDKSLKKTPRLLQHCCLFQKKQEVAFSHRQVPACRAALREKAVSCQEAVRYATSLLFLLGQHLRVMSNFTFCLYSLPFSRPFHKNVVHGIGQSKMCILARHKEENHLSMKGLILIHSCRLFLLMHPSRCCVWD